MNIKQIKGFPDYFVSDEGDIYSKKYHYRQNKDCHLIKLNPILANHGYFTVGLWKNKTPTIVCIHRLVAEAFIPNPDNKPCVNHIDGNKQNNCVSNLEWNTYSENNFHAFKCGLKKPTWLGKKGKDNPNSKIVLQIKDGKIIAEFYGAHEAQRKTGIDYRWISRCCYNEYLSSKGYHWKFKEKKND